MKRDVSAIVVAGGSGSRYGGTLNKVYLPIKGKAAISYSLEALLKHPRTAEIILVYRKEDETEAAKVLTACEKDPAVRLLSVPGGATRAESVRRGLALCTQDVVIVQDAARPALKQAYIDGCLKAMEEYPGAAVAVPSRDTVKLTDENGVVISTTERARTWLVQTPQCFRREALAEGHRRFGSDPDVTDDCMLLEKMGLRVKLVPGDEGNVKITRPGDEDRVEL